MDYFLPTSIVSVIGLVGLYCAVAAWLQLKQEFAPLIRLKEFFSNGQGPLHALAPDKLYSTQPADWLLDHQIELESHAADHLLAVWGGWLANRLPTLGEFHSLSARRERARAFARWAGGIAAVLLVCGVAGTLWAIHPVLDGFTIRVGADGVVQDASKSAENIMTMVHQLGKSFYPSIAAIFFTLIVVAARSLYHRSAYHLGRSLDRFAVESLLPAFRLRTVGEEFEDTRVKLGSVADAVARRDSEFAAAVEALAEIIKDMRAAAPELRNAARQVATAANKLSTDATQVVNGLTSHFGKDGTLVKSIVGFKDSVTRNQEAAVALAGASKKMEDTAQTLSSAAQYVPGALEKGCADGISRFAEQARQTFNEGGRNLTSVIQSASAPLKTAAATIQDAGNAAASQIHGAGNELQANGQSAREAITTILGEAKDSLNAAASQIHGAGNELQANGQSAREAITTILGEAKDSLNAAASQIHGAGNELQANGQSAREAITTMIFQAKSSMDAAVSQVHAGTEAAAEQLARNFEDNVRQPLDGSIAHLTQTQQQVSESLETLSEFAAQAVRLPQPGKLVEAADRVSAVSEELQLVAERLEKAGTVEVAPTLAPEDRKPLRFFGQ